MRYSSTSLHRVSIISIICLGAIIALIFWLSPKEAYTADTTKQGFTTNMMKSMSSTLQENKSRKGLIESYCTAMSKSQGFPDPNAKGRYYDPQSSFFVGLLCSKGDVEMEKIKEFTKEYDREELKVEGCKRDGDMTSCDFSLFLPKLFALVINDISKTKLVQLYSNQSDSTEEAVKAFSDTYFGSGESICKKKDTLYLSDKEGTDKEAACNHPETRNVVKDYIEKVKEMSDKTKYIDAEKLLKNQSKECEKDAKQFVVCSFDNQNTLARDSFHNLLYNELLFYKLFITLAQESIQYPEYNEFRAFSDISQESKQETIRLNEEITLSADAILYTEKTLQNMQATFPVHIGLLAYYEDLVDFRKSLIRIYTPLNQLYYKFRNVQQRDK